MNYNLIRSRRKTISIQILENGEVLVKAPIKCNIKVIQDFVNSKQTWIQNKVSYMFSNKQKYSEYYNLNKIMLLGKSYNVFDFSNYYQIDNDKIKHIKNANKKNVIKKYVFEKGKGYILDRLDYISNKLKLEYLNVKIISAKKKWGSCNSKKELKFNYKLYMLPEPLIDYVICHELCHLKELNHSTRFWQLLSKLGFNKSEIRKQIKQYSFVLNVF